MIERVETPGYAERNYSDSCLANISRISTKAMILYPLGARGERRTMKEGDMLTCPVCERQFPYSSYRAKRKYCSKECQVAGRRITARDYYHKHRARIINNVRIWQEKNKYLEYIKRHKEKPDVPYELSEKQKVKKPAMSLEEIAKAAKAKGISYGQYVARYGN